IRPSGNFGHILYILSAGQFYFKYILTAFDQYSTTAVRSLFNFDLNQSGDERADDSASCSDKRNENCRVNRRSEFRRSFPNFKAHIKALLHYWLAFAWPTLEKLEQYCHPALPVRCWPSLQNQVDYNSAAD